MSARESGVREANAEGPVHRRVRKSDLCIQLCQDGWWAAIGCSLSYIGQEFASITFALSGLVTLLSSLYSGCSSAISEATCHPLFERQHFKNDICLLKLKTAASAMETLALPPGTSL